MTDAVKCYCSRASAEQLAAHFQACDAEFLLQLTERVEIVSYANKIANKADRFEAWANGKLIGLVAAYCNAQDRSAAFITSVSVLPQWQGRGIASRLLDNCITHVRGLSFERLELEVSESNDSAIALYKKYGFSEQNQPAALRKMKIESGNETQRSQVSPDFVFKRLFIILT